jgi:hypothetical protein
MKELVLFECQRCIIEGHSAYVLYCCSVSNTAQGCEVHCALLYSCWKELESYDMSQI